MIKSIAFTRGASQAGTYLNSEGNALTLHQVTKTW